MQTLTLQTPDDWHVHFRDTALLRETVPATARVFRRAIAMPNLVPPVSTTAAASAYKQRLLDARPAGSAFEPLMTLYLTPTLDATEIARAAAAGIRAVKLYPAGATTHSEAGVGDLDSIYPTLEALQAHGMLLLVHGEVVDPAVDVFDREREFIDRHLRRIAERMPDLKIVLEHISTREAVEFVTEAGANVAATITPQHLLLNRNDLLVGGLKPHNYCLPVLKRRTHQEALRAAAVSGSRKFFLGTDSAPHEQMAKESSCGCAGCYSAPTALELYAQIFDELGALDRLEGFASHHGADFYGLPRNTGHVTLVRQPWSIPERIALPGGGTLVPLLAGMQLDWQIQTIGSERL
ncbi:dihydroorotase [Acidihalobacter ferrooxydans]|uniref:Dihydroorotase n=1 Tax=Acidihalobacter ferrooxydans TaxID=1765967 RepID=A0A1P8UG88_9GAMM|nr:dihydroorotase [Acidihalobacter ferrooxydans]APZ42856.1 dihydroorotase [Acidihalobacter ferrooxydans]